MRSVTTCLLRTMASSGSDEARLRTRRLSEPRGTNLRIDLIGRCAGVLGFLWLIALSGCLSPMKPANYTGDGQMKELPFLLNPGIRVDFDKFSLASTHQAAYNLGNLPRHKSPYFVGLSVQIDQGDHDQEPRAVAGKNIGRLTLRMKNVNGDVIFDCDGSLDQLGWIWAAGERLGYFGDMSSRKLKSMVYPTDFSENNGLGVLEVNYEPAENAPDIVAWIRLTAGGEK